MEAKTCFLACPLGNSHDKVRDHADWLFDILKNVFSKADVEIIRADKITATGCINKQILERIITADLLIADLTDCNPNVLFELGFRYALGRPLIQIIKGGSKNTF
ncbi:MAG: hypothetical protein KDI90_06525 [Alphaproteobacteria bacterium]|nr:hypothetical protein [Alphaproteobacteria bacterium]MCB9974969.1 hypothetical protein [Rhodospirillales bacterium]